MDHYRDELHAQMSRATKRGAKHILINVRDLQASFGDFTNSTDEMIPCRLAMRAEMVLGDVIIVAESNSAGMTVQYALPRKLN